MGVIEIAEELIEALESRLFSSTWDNSKKALFYIVVSLTIVASIVVLLSLLYAGSLNPADLFKHKENFNFAGSPDSISYYSYSSDMDIDIIDDPDDEDNGIVLVGEWKISLMPTEGILLLSDSGDRRIIDKNITITTQGNSTCGWVIKVNRTTIGVRDNIMHFTDTQVNIDKTKDSSSYSFIAMPEETAEFEFCCDKNPKMYSISNIKQTNCPSREVRIEEQNNSYTFSGNIDFIGLIRITGTAGSQSINCPVKRISDYPTDFISFNNGQGDFYIGGRDQKYTKASNVDISSPESSIRFNIEKENVEIYGSAESILANEKELVVMPVMVMLNEKYFLVIIGALFSILLLFLHRMLTLTKKKK